MGGDSTELATLTPARLVERIQCNDEGAKTELYNRYAGRLLGILRRETGNEDHALDLCQQAFMVVLEKLETQGPDDPDRIGGFIYGVAKNLLRSGWRRVERQRTDTNTELIERLADEATNPYLQVSQQQLANAVRESIDQLDIDRDREVAYRLFIDEADPTAVCQELEVSREHLSRLRYRVLQRLKKALTPAALEAAESLGLTERNGS
jgi:RNA polymerase sigma factor (sigma-70 family)